MVRARESLRYLRCECGRLLTDNIIKLGICAGHKIRYASNGSFSEWLLIKLGLWERINLWKARREKKKLGY